MMPFRLYGLIGAGLALALLAAHDVRVNHLRAGYRAQLDTIRIAFKDMGEKADKFSDILPAANKVGAERSRYRQERDEERAANEVMANSVRRAAAETEAALQQSAEAQRKIAQLTRERDQWITKARTASTRTERMTAELEVAECVSAMTELYQQGF